MACVSVVQGRVDGTRISAAWHPFVGICHIFTKYSELDHFTILLYTIKLHINIEDVYES